MKPIRDALGESKGRMTGAALAERMEAHGRAYGHRTIDALRGPYRGHTAIICGGGASLADNIGTIRRLTKRKRHHLWTVNKTHDYLLGRHFRPALHAMCDPKEWVATYVETPQPDCKYLIGSSCDPAVWDKFKDVAYLWHPGAEDLDQTVARKLGQESAYIPGPSTVGLRSVYLGYGLGFRTFHLFGFDSSYRTDDLNSLYAYDKPQAIHKVTEVQCGECGETFRTNVHMGRQAQEFQQMLLEWRDYIARHDLEPLTIKVHGDGLVPHLAEHTLAFKTCRLRFCPHPFNALPHAGVVANEFRPTCVHCI